MSLGRAIAQARKALGWSPADLADRIPTLTALGVTRIERGKEDPGPLELSAIAVALGTTTMCLRNGTMPRAIKTEPAPVPGRIEIAAPSAPQPQRSPMLKIDTILPPNAKKPTEAVERADLTCGFGAEIAKLRQARGMKQGELGEKVGLQSGTVSAIEGGRQRLTVTQLMSIMEALGMEVQIKLVPRDAA